MDLVLRLLGLIRALASDRSRLALENVVLRQQLNVLQRSVKRAKVEDRDRIFWVLMCRFFEKWKEHLVIVKPETVVRWHRQGSATTGVGNSGRSRAGRRSHRRSST